MTTPFPAWSKRAALKRASDLVERAHTILNEGGLNPVVYNVDSAARLLRAAVSAQSGRLSVRLDVSPEGYYDVYNADGVEVARFRDLVAASKFARLTNAGLNEQSGL